MIRPIESSDLPRLRELLIPLASPTGVDAFVELWLGGWPKENERGVVAEDGEVVGACWFRPLYKPTETPELIAVVAKESQGQGIGRSLLAAAFERACEIGLPELHVVFLKRNEQARRLLRGYKLDLLLEGEDAFEYMIVIKDLPHHP